MIRPTLEPRRTATLALACAAALVTAACGGGGGGGGGGAGEAPPQGPVLESIAIAPPTPSIAKGRTQAFTATGRYSDGSTEDLTLAATWSSTGGAAMTGAVATGTAEGDAVVTAAFGGKAGQAALTVTAAELDAIAIAPDSVTLPEGLTTTLVATGTWSDGTRSDVTAAASWRSDDLLAASVVAGVVTAVGQGEAIVSAALGGRSATTSVSVGAPALQRIALSPASASIPKGRGQQLVATGHYTNGTEEVLTPVAVWSSASDAVATVSAGLVSAVGLGTTEVSASCGEQTGTAAVEVTAPALDAIAVSPATPTLASGFALAFAATARYSDGSTGDVTALATWTSSRTDVATLAGAVATGAAQGTTTISAAYDGKTDETALTVTAPVLQEVTVSPASATIAKGLTATFTATARWSDGTTTDATASAAWATDAPAVASAAAGVVRGLSEGATRVTATLDGVSAGADVAVGPAEVATLTLSPADAALAAGTSLAYDAVAVYTDGSKEDVTGSAAWAAAPSEVVTISAGGLTTGASPGAASVSATYAGVSAQTPLTVTSAVLVSVAVSPSEPTVPLGVDQPFTAIGIYSDGSRQDLTTQVLWAAAPQDVAAISAAGVATPVGQGTATITATRDGVSGTTTLAVTAATLSALVVDPSDASIAAGTTAPFTATGIYSDGSTADVTALATWSSSDGTVAQVSNAAGSRGVATALAPGVVTVTASFGDQTDASTLMVTSATLVGVSVAPATVSVPKGRTQPLAATGTFSDGTTQDLTALAGWTSSDPAVASVSNAAGEEGVVTAIAPGTVTVTATYGALGGTAAVTVTDATVVAIDVTPATATLPAGYTRPFAATARYSDGSSRDVTTQVTWQSSNPAVATISNAAGTQGLATGIAANATPVRITATLPGVVGAASLTVTSTALQSIAVAPNPFTVAVKGTVQLVATGRFADGTLLDVTAQCTWASSSRGVARVSRTGVVTGVAAGQVTISAKKKGKTGSAAGTVL